MIDEIVCPRCHNKFPSTNKVMHDLRCTDKSPVEFNQKGNKVIHSNPKKYDRTHKYNTSTEYKCYICGLILPIKFRNDHLLQHRQGNGGRTRFNEYNDTKFNDIIGQNIINNLPESIIEDVDKLDAERKNCIICLTDFINGDRTTPLPCFHMFHSDCIKSWLKDKTICPVCKLDLTKNNLF